MLDIVGNIGAVAPVHKVVGKLKTGVTLLVTVKARVSVIVAPQVFVAVKTIFITCPAASDGMV